MLIRFDEQSGILDVDGVRLSASILAAIVNPDNRLLWRFEQRDGIITGTAYSEAQVLWLDKSAGKEEDEQSLDLGLFGEP